MNRFAMQLDAEQLLSTLVAKIGPLPSDTAVVGIHSGGVWVAQRLHALLHASPPLGTLAVTLHRDDFSKIGLHPQRKVTDMPVDIDRHVGDFSLRVQADFAEIIAMEGDRKRTQRR
jgi:pyrimidine operon attenuation protein/uracil phosphoribosyltransferase